MSSAKDKKTKIITCAGTGCLSADSDKVKERIEDEIKERKLKDRFEITYSGCHGMCEQGPVVVIYPEGIFYPKVSVKNIGKIIDSYLNSQRFAEELIFEEYSSGKKIPYYEEIPFYKKQRRIALKNCGKINPEKIENYLELDGYSACRKVFKEMTAEEVIEEITNSGIRGRGGAGFPTGKKWAFARNAQGDVKYLICNADEGDPGAFMDRSILEGDPHSVLEGMIIAGYAIGSNQGIIYIRAEYPLAVHRLRIAIKQAQKRGFLGKKIFKSNFDFDIKIKEGAGAFVCGEETALIASVEGKRGMPRMRPPYPAISGLWGKPTNVNNVETLANIPWIINNGAKKYSKIGTKTSTGTKVFALTGKIRYSGLVEVPMGVTINEVIFGIGGGIKGDKKFKAVQIGGPSGGCIPAEYGDTKIDYESLVATGAIMGSGGMVVLDETSCMVDLARFFLTFTQNESCGKCVPCRIGTKRMLEILERITQGKGKEDDIERIESLAELIKTTSLCALGQTAPNPVLTTLRYFRDEYEDHIFRGSCTANFCKDLINLRINQKLCRQCALCIKNCPVDAITGGPKKKTVIDKTKCIKCKICIDVCPFDAVVVV